MKKNGLTEKKLKGITITSKGKPEQRYLLSKGSFIIYGYRDLSKKVIPNKYSIILIHENKEGDKKIEQIMIVNTKDKKEIIVKHKILKQIPEIADE
jgi:hypothetical protein